jgi:hypothetical protein
LSTEIAKTIRIASWAEDETGRLGTTAYDTMNNLHDLTWILRIAMHNTSAQREAESPAERGWKLAKDAKAAKRGDQTFAQGLRQSPRELQESD